VTKYLINTLLGALLLLNFLVPAYGAEKPTLLEMQKQEGLSSTRISLIFDQIPVFTSEHSGQRLDILLDKAAVSKGLMRLPEDETVVKILLAEKGGDILVSLLLRRPPKQIVSKSQEHPARIDFDLYWDSARGTRPAVAFRIEGIPGIKGGRKLRAAQQFPLWSEGWRELFKADLTPWELDPDLHFSLPELPPLGVEQPTPALQQRLDLSLEKRWLSLLRFVPEMPPVEPSEKLTEELLIIEALLRTDALAAADARLRSLDNLPGAYQARVDYLTDFVLAAEGQAYAAYLKLIGQLNLLPPSDPYYPLMALLMSETAIASGNDKDVIGFLQQLKVAWPAELKQLVTMRRGDVLSGLGQYAEALAEYRQLEDSALLFNYYPRARARAAQAAFEEGDYRLAARLYKNLGAQLAGQPLESLAFYAAAASNYDAGETEWAQIGLQKIFLEMPGTEGAERAILRMQDHQVLIGGEREKAEAAYKYGEWGQKSRQRDLREEASFKQALALYLLGDSAESVRLLMDFRRVFASGTFRPQADSLLLEQLPGLITRLIDKGEDIAAMVLVEQNRNLLLKGKLEKAFLGSISGALTRLGLYERATRILLFQLDRAADKSAREEVYLPLAQLFLLRQEYKAASDYAQMYLETYPRGEMRGDIYSVMLDALEKQKRLDDLLRQLERADRPQSARLDIRSAWIYWEQGRLADAVTRLESALKVADRLEVKEMALLAESLYQLGRREDAEKFYQQLRQDEKFGSQASYRSAQLLLRRGKTMAGLKLLRSLVEKDKIGPWSLLAQDLLKEVK